ncbi:MAG: hypothetical protein COZ91_01360 [Candidatus Nealsonbacteria bacterium CG_4_8_14_3_um_filter_39_7]|nr:MAG: hypothetical protein COZ91_01360 [Candidatus Nealsonbacteria bacterium CG_4_8_14_3_um_filter_39_7]
MQVFEFHFNPDLKPSLIFDSFCYEPENVYERRVGSLYMLGLLRNAIPHDAAFLDKLAKLIRERYYGSTLVSSEESLKKSLQKANEYLQELTKNGEVGWLGNLNLGAIAIKNSEINFTKTGDIKFILIREGQLINIDEKIKNETIEPFPLKVFGNIASGKIAEGDILMAFTKDVFDFFTDKKLTEEIAKIKPFNGESLKLFLKSKKKELSVISGVFLLLFLNDKTPKKGNSKEIPVKENLKENSLAPQKKERISSRAEKKEFSFREAVFIPFTAPAKKAKNLLMKKIILPVFNFLKSQFKKTTKKSSAPKIKKTKKDAQKKRFHINLPALDNFSFPVLKLKMRIKDMDESRRIQSNLFLIFSFFICLFIGFLIFSWQENKKVENYREDFEKIEQKVEQAESFLLLKETNPQARKDADVLLEESWNEISVLIKESVFVPKELRGQILSLENKISQELNELNNLEEIKNPEIFFQFKSENFVPQRIISFGKDNYFFSHYAQGLFRLDEKGQGNKEETEQKFDSAANLTDFVILFSGPNQITGLNVGGIEDPLTLVPPYPEANLSNVSSFASHLYFLDKKSGKIIKYPFLGKSKWVEAVSWLSSDASRNIDAKSMAVDDNVWVLAKDNSIYRYYAGEFKETLKIDIFPAIKDLSKIFTSTELPYLYISEPSQKRIIILDKTGKVIRQFQSDSFDNLLDFSVSENGKTIYILNGLEVFKITF